LGRKREGLMPSEGQGAGSTELRGERKSGGAKKEFGLQETGKANVQGKDAGPDWREAIIRYLSSPSNERDKRVHQQALKYVVMDDELYRRTMDGMLLRCLGEEQSRLAMGELHEGLCGTHQAAPKMKWALRRVGFFWPIMMSDCVGYQRRCAACQWFGNIQTAPASLLNPIVKPWPFKGWGLDFIGEIHPSSSKGHRFI
jgi:hypothetical protein